MVTLILTRIVFVLSIPLCLYAVYFGVVALFGLRKKTACGAPGEA